MRNTSAETEALKELVRPKRKTTPGQLVAVVLVVLFLIVLGVLIAMAFQIGPAVLEAVCR